MQGFTQYSHNGWWAPPTEFSRTGLIASVLLTNILEWSAGAPWLARIALKRGQAKIVCLVLGSSDPNYRTKQMEVGDALLPQVTSQQMGSQSLKWPKNTWRRHMLLTKRLNQGTRFTRHHNYPNIDVKQCQWFHKILLVPKGSMTNSFTLKIEKMGVEQDESPRPFGKGNVCPVMG